jgi:ribosomal protein S12 methylthiotransferase accessory factor
MNIEALKPNSSTEATTARLVRSLLDPTVGILQKLEEVPRFPGDPEFFHYLGKACSTFPFSGQKNFYNSGGASVDREIALLKAVGEAVERYSSAIYDRANLPVTSRSKASFACVPIDSFALYSEKQYACPDFMFVPLTESTSIRWTEMVDVTNDAKVFAPAAAVYMPYFYVRGERDAPILQPISTGLACHQNLETASISAICEVVERDSVMLVWQGMVSCSQVRIETLSDKNYDITRRLEKDGSKVIVLDITSDNGIPTILSVLDGGQNPDHPSLIFAGAADPDPERAVRKSLEELPHTRRYCARLMEFSPRFEVELPDHPNVLDQEHHLHLYCDHNNRKYADFVFLSQERKSFSEIRSMKANSAKITLQSLIEAVKRTGENIYIKDLTTPDIEPLGLSVVRALIPGYQRLCMGHQNRTLGGRRLREVPSKMGYVSVSMADGMDNPYPHPYP